MISEVDSIYFFLGRNPALLLMVYSVTDVSNIIVFRRSQSKRSDLLGQESMVYLTALINPFAMLLPQK